LREWSHEDATQVFLPTSSNSPCAWSARQPASTARSGLQSNPSQLRSAAHLKRCVAGYASRSAVCATTLGITKGQRRTTCDAGLAFVNPCSVLRPPTRTSTRARVRAITEVALATRRAAPAYGLPVGLAPRLPTHRWYPSTLTRMRLSGARRHSRQSYLVLSLEEIYAVTHFKRPKEQVAPPPPWRWATRRTCARSTTSFAYFARM